MRTIRGWAAGAAVLLASLGATEATAKQIYLDEVIRMSSAGVLEEIIMSEVIVTKSVFELSPDDIVRLSEAGLSDQLIQFLIDTGRPEGSKSVDVDPDDRPLPDFEDDDLASTGATDTPGTPITLDDVIWMNASGVLDEIIMSEVVATETVFVLTPKDIIRLSQAGISDDLIQFLMETGEQAEDSTSEPQLAVPDYEDDDTDVYLGFGFNYGYYGAWYDPWYYSYSPYCLSFSWGWGYPGWYYTPYCWSSYGYGYCGYGYAPYCGYGWSGYSGDCFATGGYPGGYPGGAYGLSTEKWKTNGGAAGSPLALKEPRVADYSPKLASLEKAAPGEGPSVRDYAKVDSKSLDERVRPVRNTRPTRSVKAPRANDGSVKYAHVAPDRVREPAKGSKPSKVTKAATNSNGKVSRSKAIEPGGKGTKSKSTVVRPTAKSSGKSSTPVYRSARATRTPSGGKSSPAVRSAPTSRSSHVVRSTPTRSSAPTRSMSTGRSAPSYRSAPVRSSYGSGGGRSYSGGYGGGRSYGGGYGGGRASGGGGRGR